MNKGYINNQAALVLNKLDLQDNSQPLGADNLPIGMREDNANKLSCNYGTDRPLENGWAIVGNGSVSITVTGLLATDTVEYPHGGDSVTLATDTINIPLDNEVIAFNILRGGSLWASFNLESRSQNYLLDNSGFDRHGLIVNYYAGLWIESNEYSALDEVGYTLSDGVTYYLNDNATGLIEANVYIPKLQGSANKCVAYLANGERADLQYIGSAPSRGKFISNVYEGFDGAHFTKNYASPLDILSLTSFSIHARVLGEELRTEVGTTALVSHRSDNVPIFSIDVRGDLSGVRFLFRSTTSTKFFDLAFADIPDGELDLFFEVSKDISNNVTLNASINGALVWDLTFLDSGTLISDFINVGKAHLSSAVYSKKILEFNIISSSFTARCPLVSYIEDPSNYTAYDVSSTLGVPNGNHFTLISGSINNRAHLYRNGGDYSQLGKYNNGTQDVPILADLSAFADGTPLSSGVIQDGNSFLDTGTKLQATPTPRISQAEKVIRKYTDANGDYITLSHADFTGAETGDQDFNDVSETDIVKDMRKHHQALEGRQLLTEKVITKN